MKQRPEHVGDADRRVTRRRRAAQTQPVAIPAGAGVPLTEAKPDADLVGAGRSTAAKPPVHLRIQETQLFSGSTLLQRAAQDGTPGLAVTAKESPRPRLPATTGAGHGVALIPGLHIDKYELIRELGHGGMGSVFLARDTRLGRLVAIKFLHRDSGLDSERFLAEARTTAQCQHENIVVIHDYGEYGGQQYMVLEYIEGKTLRQTINASVPANQAPEVSVDGRHDGFRACVPLSPERVVEIMVPALRALQQAHQMGIVHRDLKPENIMVTSAGTVKVLDFGIAKMLTHEHSYQASVVIHPEPSNLSMTRPGILVGTIPYMSPEQLNGDPVDHRTDIWAVGIMVFEMLTGRHPLAPLSMSALYDMANDALPMPRVSDFVPDIGTLGAIVDRCLLKHPADRTATVGELLDQLVPLIPGNHNIRLDVDESPFAGLAAFQESNADRFFGRAEDIAGVVARVRNQPLVVVVGSSGVGKSSLIRAGVVPALKRSGEGWDALVTRPGRTPLAALAELLMHLSFSTSSTRLSAGTVDMRDSSAPDQENALSAQPSMMALLRREPGHLGSELRAWSQRKLRRMIVFVDQFEEIYTLGADPDERAAFLACLASVADDASSPLRVILSMRTDFLERMSEDRQLMAMTTRGLYFLSPVGGQGLRDALTRPVAAAGYAFESEEMVEDMLDELHGTPSALTLLQFAASQLWQDRDREHRLLTRDSYQAMGGVAGILARHADAVLTSMPAQRMALVRTLFLRLITLERTRAIASVGELRELSVLPGEVDRVLHELADARLVSIEGRRMSERSGDSLLDYQGSNASVEIVHESLIESWPTLRRWLDDSREQAAFLARLRAATREWEKSGQAEGMLWRDDIVRDARDWYERYPGEVGEREQRYLDAVFELADRARRRQRKVIYGTMSALAVLLVAATIVIIMVRGQNRIIRSQLDELQRRQDALVASDKARKQARAAADKAASEADLARAQAVRDKAVATTFERKARQAEGQSQRAAAAEQHALARAEENARAERAARLEAERARDQAAKAQEAAEQARLEAERARDRERKAREQAEALLANERARREQLRDDLGGDLTDTIP